MKAIRYTLLAAISSLFISVACTKDAQQNSISQPKAETNVAAQSTSFSGRGTTPGPCNPNAYNIVLESKTLVNGNWEWVWSVQNTNPGGGNNGTIQDLSHWGMQFGACVNPATFVSAAYSADGNTWTSFTASIQQDVSQSCMTTPVLKFDFGTIGSAKSYYRLTVSQEYLPAQVPGYYKSGTNTGCCTFYFTGMGCSTGQEEE